MVASLQAGELDLDNVRHLILDEADRLLDTEFLGQTQEIIALCTHPQCQKAVFSATLPSNAEKIALGMLNDPIRVVVGLKCATIYLDLLDELTTSQIHSPPEH
jgi:ATP-dependent RNA helicase DDX52/ROK1